MTVPSWKTAVTSMGTASGRGSPPRTAQVRKRAQPTSEWRNIATSCLDERRGNRGILPASRETRVDHFSLLGIWCEIQMPAEADCNILEKVRRTPLTEGRTQRYDHLTY